MIRSKVRELVEEAGLLSVYHDLKIGTRQLRSELHALHGRCPLCRHRRLKLKKVTLFHAYLRCTACNLQFVFPTPSQRTLNRFYRPPDFVDRRNEFHGNSQGDDIWKDWIEFKRVLFSRLGLEKPEVSDQTHELLEIGSGEGNLLELFAGDGWQVTGIELNQQLASALQQRGFRIHTRPFEKIDFGNRRYQLILAFHVLEHFRDPFRVLDRIASLLAPGGDLVLETPISKNYESIDHLYFFNEPNLEIALQDRGLEVVSRFIYTDQRHEEFRNCAVRCRVK